ncbi:MAG: DUF1566 domain-containing protein [Campylobacterota bacterium]|nr:DUF1566 domain-containing protein [Campylobacterota bacterium]
MKIKILLLLTSYLLPLTSLNAEFLRDDTNQIVLDKNTNLVWQDDIHTTTYTWENAISYCENLDLAGYTNWKLPNINELKTIVDDTIYSPSIYSEFKNTVSSDYWSSTTNASITSHAWTVYINVGATYYDDKTYFKYVRCVRSGQ